MTADVTREPTGGQGLREAVARHLFGLQTSSWVWDECADLHGAFLAQADAVLALPEVGALIADADNWRHATTGDPTEPLPLAMQARDLLVRNRGLEAQVARVRELLAAMDPVEVALGGLMYVHGEVTRALDGEPQP